MKHFYFLFILFIYSNGISAQIFTQETIKTSGDNDKRINLVILGDGYQATELGKFKTDAQSFITKLFGESPFTEYSNYFNVHIINVISEESGADHPVDSNEENGSSAIFPQKEVNTFFNATFDAYKIHRLLFFEIDGNYANDTTSKINSVLADNFPTYDQAIILVNTPYYGGAGGEFPMASTHVDGAAIAIHELGHSFANLKDEYYAGDVYAGEAINMTSESDPSVVKWKNWVGSNGIDVYLNGTTIDNVKWYKPANGTCKMEALGADFCSVCKEGIIEKIHGILPAIESYTPNTTTVNNPTFPVNFDLNLIAPTHELERTWTLNGLAFASGVDGVALENSDLNSETNTLTAVVEDNPAALLRINNHETVHISTVTWTIENSALGIETIESVSDNFEILMFPNPVSNTINLKFESSSVENLSVEIITMDGRKLLSTSLSNYEIKSIDTSTFSSGIYLTNFYANQALIASKKLVKK